MQRITNIKNRKFYIYVLKEPNTLEIKYVGVTCTSLSSRLSQHIYDSKKGGTYKRNWIKSLINNNLKPIIEKIEECNYSNWEEREKHWINFYDNLTNTREGGKGVILNRTKESIKKSSEAKMKKVVCIDSNRNVFFYNSLKEASELTGVPRTSIEYSISKLEYCSYGFNFLLEKDYFQGLENNLVIKLKKHKYKIIHLDIEYTPIQFAQKLNISETTVYLWCEGKIKWENSFSYDGNLIKIIKI